MTTIRRVVFGVVVAVALLSTAAAENFTARIFGIIDGSTLRVNIEGGKSIRVRLYGIDCPLINQPHGIEAKALTRKLAYGRVLVIESAGGGEDGEIFGHVFLLSGKSLSHELVRAGACWWYRQSAPRDESLRQLEREARSEERGLWAAPDPTPPWEWRKP